MLIGLLSDTHDHAERMARAVELLLSKQVEALIHCGDLCAGSMLELFPAAVPCFYVQGNNDWAEELKPKPGQSHLHFLGEGATLNLGGKRLAATHGHRPKVTQQLLDKQPTYLFRGHTHQPEDRQAGAVRWINPGALTRARVLTVAVLDLTEDRLQYHEVER